MTIINHASDGLYPELIALARASSQIGAVAADELVSVCAIDNATRLRGSLSRWTALGLFHDGDGKLSIAKPYARAREESLDDWTARIPQMCRALALAPSNCLPLWGANEGTSADLARGLAWVLSQDIFTLPRAWSEEAELLVNTQVRGTKLIQNDTRWSGLRFWARYLGFATGGSKSFFVDPTEAVKSATTTFLKSGDSLDAVTFINELGQRLPVLDGGTYRLEVEGLMDDAIWRRPSDGHLSMALSFAIRRLRLDGFLILEAKSDARGFTLTGKDYTSAGAFTHVRARRMEHESQ